MAYNWSEFTVHTYYQAAVDELFQMWATPGGLERFFVKSTRLKTIDGTARGSTELAQADDEYHWKWMHDYKLSARITDLSDRPSVSFSFGSMEVTVEIIPTGNKSLVRLRQFNIPAATEADKAANHLNCRSC